MQVTITTSECQQLGLVIGSHPNRWGTVLRPLAISKGVPAELCFAGSSRLKAIFHDDGLDLVWDDDYQPQSNASPQGENG